MAKIEVKDFFGRDPLKGEDARKALISEMGAGAIEVIVPLEGGYGCSSLQVESRLKMLGQDLGSKIAPHLLKVLIEAPWNSKTSATPCYGGIEATNKIVTPIIDILKHGENFENERMAIEALGYLGANAWAFDLAEYAKSGIWAFQLPQYGKNGEHISKYPFGKLASYVLEALARFVARSNEINNRALFKQLTEFLLLYNKEEPGGPNLVERHKHEFTGSSVDLLIDEWLRGSNVVLQELAADLLGSIAPVRAARYLLQVATSPSTPPSLQRSASVALGEIRHPVVAQLLADALRDEDTPKQNLEWAFSTLYAVPIDWTGTEAYVDEVLNSSEEPSAQLQYSLAMQGDSRCRTDLESRLDADTPFKRWSSALALARLLGSKGRELLEHRAEDASDSIERCAMWAALIRCGDHSKVSSLHEALTETTTLPLLRTIWQIELLDVFRQVPSFDDRAFGLWRIAAGLGVRQVQYFDALKNHESEIYTLTPRPKQLSLAAEKSSKPLKLFVSYSHADKGWLERFQLALSPLVRSERMDLWDDTQIVPGKWRVQINDALSNANAALFLVSTRLLASDFIMKHELPDLLNLAEQNGVKIIWILLEDCLWEESGLAEYQGENAGQPLSTLPEGEQNRIIMKTCRRIRDLL